MGNSNTTNKSFNDPDDGEYARRRLGSWLSTNWGDLDTILGRFEREELSPSNGNTANISGGESVHAVAAILDETNNGVGLFSLEGGANSVTELAESGSNFGGSGSTENVLVYNDSNNNYVVENNSGSSITLEVILLRAV